MLLTCTPLAAAVDRYGKHFLDCANTMRFADGGLVSRAMSNSTTYGGNVANDRRIFIDNVTGPDIRSIEVEADRRRRTRALGSKGIG